MLSLTYEEIERQTHVRIAFLAALEQGAIDDLPSPVQTRGVLANYAGFLDLDVDTIMLRFADGVQARYREKGPAQPARTRAPMTVHTTLPPLRSFIASDLVFGGGVAVTLLLFAIWGISRVMIVRSANAPVATPPPISDVLVGTALPTLVQQVTVIPAQVTPSAVALEGVATLDLATLDPNVKVNVKLSASQGTYMRVTVDGQVQFEGRAELGSDYVFQASEQVEIVVGNAAALRVNYNGRDLGLMGNFGEVIDRLYTVTGVATPTSTAQPTRTPTPKTTATPSLTPTITPSVTRTPTPGG
jgi:cytoskeletal protein RodZ